MKILGIETSCDETGASVIEGDLNPPAGGKTAKILSNVVASSLALHSKTGGIIPEVAAREQVKYIIPVIKQAMEDGKCKMENLDAIAVTIGPGLIGSLLVGVETAKTLSFVWQKPIIPVNHLIGHIYANFVTSNKQQPTTNKKLEVSSQKLAIGFPAIALIVSGGHTDLVLMEKHGSIRWLGGTRDDAAGEAFDKIGRLLNIPYPAGQQIEKLAENGDPKSFNFPRPMINSNDFDFSFSGLKTAVFREVKSISPTMNYEPFTINNLCASVQEAIVDVLIKKTLNAAQKYRVKSILFSGGVAANELLRNSLGVRSQKLAVKFFAPAKNLCTDNAAMIASAAFFNYNPVPWQKITANPELYFQ